MADVDGAVAAERNAILDILVEAARVRECFHSFGTTMKNNAGNDIFIDAKKIDAAIETIRSRGDVSGVGK